MPANDFETGEPTPLEGDIVLVAEAEDADDDDLVYGEYEITQVVGKVEGDDDLWCVKTGETQRTICWSRSDEGWVESSY